jgi:hypothetical protein
MSLEQTCFICEEPMLLDDANVEAFDKSCFLLVHKDCKKNFQGKCPVCKKEKNQEGKCSMYIYASLLSLTSVVFITAFVCVIVIVAEKLNI